jgi:hypothetical protein
MKKILAIILLISLTSFTCDTCKLTKRECIVKFMEGEVGVREQGGNNIGERVEFYQKEAGAPPKTAWCASILVAASKHCSIPQQFSAWSPSVTAKKRIYDRRYPNDNVITPQAGDFATLYYPNLKRIGHALMVYKWSSKWVETIEGNTSEMDTRETSSGRDGVFKKKRLKASIYQVSRYWN